MTASHSKTNTSKASISYMPCTVKKGGKSKTFLMNRSDQERIIDDMIIEDPDSSIADYLELMREIERVEIATVIDMATRIIKNKNQ